MAINYSGATSRSLRTWAWFSFQPTNVRCVVLVTQNAYEGLTVPFAAMAAF
jgi:hypothetical protein